ncbi:hypothetical protein PsorP6_018064 [Peronosclerospora sorghi]|uniref:Uncharacterized protein n=1 Tax=Peronosclerospora sorghi TaxID=230839 RepID=A0ACC0WFM7_9STRA|nr:hypothetical protein PsorP6_018064 [Peronosclerospora sorghi]
MPWNSLVETIGRGAYGTVGNVLPQQPMLLFHHSISNALGVHKAINLSSGAAVAVKVIAKEQLRRPQERESIEKEIETMRVAVEQFENGHPHIVRLLCTKESQQYIFIVQVREKEAIRKEGTRVDTECIAHDLM